MLKADALRKLRSLADYQFGAGCGEILFPRGVKLEYSARTARVRRVFLRGKLLATLRPRDGSLGLTIFGGRMLLRKLGASKRTIVAREDAAEFIQCGGDVFAKHVIRCDAEIRPMEEVIVTNPRGKVVGVGRALLAGSEMTAFKRGVAVKIRHGAKDRE